MYYIIYQCESLKEAREVKKEFPYLNPRIVKGSAEFIEFIEDIEIK